MKNYNLVTGDGNELDFDRALGGWLPPQPRSEEQESVSDWYSAGFRNDVQMRATDEYHERIGNLEDVVSYGDDIPEHWLSIPVEVAATGSTLPRVRQSIGSCVGAAGGFSYQLQAAIECVAGDHEAVKLPFFPFTWGVGRGIGFGPNVRRGDGSFGSAQAKAVQQVGQLPHDWTRHELPDPAILNGWARWAATVEREWSAPRQFPIDVETLEPYSKKYAIETAKKVNDVDALAGALARGLTATAASMYGFSPRVVERHGVRILEAAWSRRWAHQMSVTSYLWRGEYFLIQNQWGNSHGICPYVREVCQSLDAPVVNGCAWCPRDDMAKIIRTGEVYVHQRTGGFDPPLLDYKLTV